MPDDCVPALRVVPEKPPIAVWARVKFSHSMKLLRVDAAGSGVSFNRSIAPAISRHDFAADIVCKSGALAQEAGWHLFRHLLSRLPDQRGVILAAHG